MTQRFRFRVERWGGGAPELIGSLPDGPAHHSALEPFISRLLRDGKDGTVALVDAVTGEVLAKRTVQPFRVRRGPFDRPGGGGE